MSETKKQHKPAQSQFEAYFRRGTELLHEGKAAQAAPLLQKAYDLEPEHVDTAVNLSGAYILTNKFRQAVPILEALAARRPDDPAIWTNLGAAYLGNPVLAADEDQLRAITAFQQALALDPGAPHVAYNIGLVYRDRHENEQAITWFQRALQANPHDRDAQRLLNQLSQPNDPTPLQ
ncbi:MAG TPA: tetratricopeptide repeat protein [Chloroflexota bacterium]|nr:tetratricopeptide repeat protein [Chloroflexota bacterium]HUM69831.1 tetratricopeptide repeat protein [Chloroflexota bacterium]